MSILSLSKSQVQDCARTCLLKGSFGIFQPESHTQTLDLPALSLEFQQQAVL